MFKSIIDTVIQSLEAHHAIDIITIDISHKTSMTDAMIICTGKSSRQVKAIATHLITEMKSHGISTLSQHGVQEGNWALVDFGDAIVHIMLPETRAFYDIEGLWQSPNDTD